MGTLPPPQQHAHPARHAARVGEQVHVAEAQGAAGQRIEGRHGGAPIRKPERAEGARRRTQRRKFLFPPDPLFICGMGHLEGEHNVAPRRQRRGEGFVLLFLAPLAEENVEDDEARPAPAKHLEHGRIRAPLPRPPAELLLEVEDAVLVDQDEDDVPARGPGPREGPKAPVQRRALQPGEVPPRPGGEPHGEAERQGDHPFGHPGRDLGHPAEKIDRAGKGRLGAADPFRPDLRSQPRPSSPPA